MQGVHLRKYGVETKIPFELYEVNGVDLRTDAADAGADCTIMKDEGVENTCVNDFADEGKGYSQTLSLAEMQAARIVVYVVDQSGTKVWLDKVIIIETYGNASAQHAFDLDTASTAQSADNETRLATIAAGVAAAAAKLLAYIRLLARSDAAVETDAAAELTAINADEGAGAGDFSSQTDSEEAIRDRGDAAWTSGGGGITDILNIQALIPNAIDLANTATVRISLGLTNMLDDLPSTGEITPGTISIDRKAIGGTSWTNIVNGDACSELAGLIYYDEVFDSGTGYAAGDTIRITFKSQKITVDANDYEIIGSDGWLFHTYIREAVGAGVSDWDADERTVIRAVLGLPASGTTPDIPTTGIISQVRDITQAHNNE